MKLNYLCKDCKEIFKSEDKEVKWSCNYPVCKNCCDTKKENSEG